MTRTVHRLHRYDDVGRALADPRLIPVPVPAPAADGGTGMAWLRATVARFSSGEAHAARRALVETDLARIDPAALRRAAASGDGAGEPRLHVVRVLAQALGLPDPEGVARAVVVVAATYFGADSADADRPGDEALAWLLPRMGAPDAPETAANRVGLLVQACDATGALIERAQTVADLRETLRHDPPVREMRRVAATDTEVAGVRIDEGDLVILDIATAGLDPAADLLTFGAAPRRCPGRDHALALAAGTLEGNAR